MAKNTYQSTLLSYSWPHSAWSEINKNRLLINWRMSTITENIAPRHCQGIMNHRTKQHHPTCVPDRIKKPSLHVTSSMKPSNNERFVVEINETENLSFIFYFVRHWSATCEKIHLTEKKKCGRLKLHKTIISIVWYMTLREDRFPKSFRHIRYTSYIHWWIDIHYCRSQSKITQHSCWGRADSKICRIAGYR